MSDREENRATQELLTEGEELYNMSLSRGWGIARARMADMILDLQNISNIDDGISIDNVLVEIKSRKAAAALLFAFLRDVEGQAAQHQTNLDLMTDKKEDDNDYISTQ